MIPSDIDMSRIPQHVAIIMDGNGRWAKQRGLRRIFGHRSGVEAVRSAVETAGELGVKYLTLYAFSTENWERPATEVEGLMSLLVDAIVNETPKLNKNNVRLNAIGDLSSFPEKVQSNLYEAINLTKQNTGLILTLALGYSAKWEIMEAVKKIAGKISRKEIELKDINASMFESCLTTVGIPDPELLIRTSGEQRISNFLLWQTAYSEFYFPKVLWPDFRNKDFYDAIREYHKRERRFGKTSEQIN